MATLVSKVRALSGSDSTITSDDQVIDFIESGVALLNRVAPLDVIKNCAITKTGSSVDELTIDSDLVLSATRDGYPCNEEDPNWMKMLDKEVSQFSMRRPTASTPAYFIEGQKIYYRPTGSTTVTATYIGIPTITNATDSWEYQSIEGPILKYAGSMDAFAVASAHFSKVDSDISNTRTKIQTWLDEAYNMRADKHTVTIPTLSYTNAEDALTKAQELIDTISNINFEYYMNLDDPEMASASINGAASEINRAAQELNKLSVQLRKYAEDIQEAGQYNQDVVNRMRTLADMAAAESNLLSADVARMNYAQVMLSTANSLYEQCMRELQAIVQVDQLEVANG